MISAQAWSGAPFVEDEGLAPLIGTNADAVRGRYVREALDQASLRQTPFAAYSENALVRALVLARSGALYGDCEALRRC